MDKLTILKLRPNDQTGGFMTTLVPVLCDYCGANETSHVCRFEMEHGKKEIQSVDPNNPIPIPICGKAFCFECKLRFGSESTNRCFDHLSFGQPSTRTSSSSSVTKIPDGKSPSAASSATAAKNTSSSKKRSRIALLKQSIVAPLSFFIKNEYLSLYTNN